jgi:HSP20 family protein
MNASLQQTRGPVAQQPRDEAPKTRTAGGVFAPRVNLLDTETELVLSVDLPGVKAEDVALDCKGDELLLHARCAPRHEGKRLLHAEYAVGDFYRAFRIAEHIDTTAIEAAMKDGVLTVRLPKSERMRPKRIGVKGG